MIEIIAIIALTMINLILIGVLVLITRENNQQVLVLTKALSAKDFSDMQRLEATTNTKQEPELPPEEFISLSDLDDAEADKLIKKQLEFKAKK